MGGLVRKFWILLRLVVRQVLNHTDPTVTAVCHRHSYDRENREALEAWERRVREITGAR